ncbi:MAG: hypothetical protein F6K10_08500 [Moorea sp. SIO2B7]|uniref:hypothetical protein n=2 Tax=unclassified Moorena TaxID=2683338 RepID=UPI0013B80157|nr:hypothetical protein [Moorena sp. SIO4E2]NEQ07065.1 hypothetical protein [Moorena sp. SIO4E2]NEQ13079.1 hypothetical protein [Moorena sp. SIO3E2]NES40797.1 hypothetical protein [Moorena sp. SIO2C4]NES81438.1 hypothetical protein [Moorena sp. SIO2B7]
MSKLKQSFLIGLNYLVLTAITMLPGEPSFAANNCRGRDCIHHELGTQAVCKLVGSDQSPLLPIGRDIGWAQGLNTEIDNKLLGGDVVAYKIRWFNGSWSGWYVTGVNDIDVKFNTPTNDMRRMWSYFTDHQHQYIICKEPK